MPSSPYKTEIFGAPRKRFHVRSESCAYGQDAPQEVLRIMALACEREFEPIGVLLTPSGAGKGYVITVYFKIPCPKAKAPESFCSLCITEGIK